ncbi:hypothetical protein [Maribacter dokdonensis]|nr:hypothetical protein [Maribacter dokdonensis]
MRKLVVLNDWLLRMFMNGKATRGEAKALLGMAAEESETYKTN